jgi:oligoendopeptidase F
MDLSLSPSRWSLQDLLSVPVEQSLEVRFSELDSLVVALEADRERLSETIADADFLEILGRYEELHQVSQVLGAYSYLRVSEDTQDQTALNLRDRIDRALIDADNRTLYFTLWFKALPGEIANRLMDISGDLHYYLESLRRFQPYTLTEPEEKIINLKDVNGVDALTGIYDMLVNRFSFTLEEEGKKKILTRDELAAYTRHPEAAMRQAAYQELYRVFIDHSTILSQIYNHRVRDWHDEAQDLRGYRSPISVRNLANDLPDPVVDALLDVCRRNVGLLQRYFKLKAERLGVKKLRRYDIYAPLIASDKTFEYAQAVDLILESLREFSPFLAEQAWRIFKENHLDAETRPGKRGGAFCYTILPGTTPYVLVNFTGRARDLATLAHELGHALHSMQYFRSASLVHHATLPLAETASTFSEMLLTDRLIREESDPAVRRDLLAYAIDDAYASIQRQAYFTLFEQQAHEMIDKGQTIEQLCAAYRLNLEEQFGDALELSDEFQWEWVMVPHFVHTPFYTYAYAFGQLLVLALYQQYRIEGDGFVPRYLKLLSYGGSESPAKILSEAGLDITHPEFWQGGFDVLKGMIDELALIQ